LCLRVNYLSLLFEVKEIVNGRITLRKNTVHRSLISRP
jgi:hypothetical protein